MESNPLPSVWKQDVKGEEGLMKYLNTTLSGFDSGGCGTSTTAFAVSPSSPPQPPQSAPDFVINTPEYEHKNAYYSWRILLQVCDMQLQDYNQAKNGDREQCLERIIDVLQRINATAGKFKPQSFPNDIKPATAGSAALSASGANWCDVMTSSLSMIFLSAPIVDISRIE